MDPSRSVEVPSTGSCSPGSHPHTRENLRQEGLNLGPCALPQTVNIQSWVLLKYPFSTNEVLLPIVRQNRKEMIVKQNNGGSFQVSLLVSLLHRHAITSTEHGLLFYLWSQSRLYICSGSQNWHQEHKTQKSLCVWFHVKMQNRRVLLNGSLSDRWVMSWPQWVMDVPVTKYHLGDLLVGEKCNFWNSFLKFCFAFAYQDLQSATIAIHLGWTQHFLPVCLA